MKKTIQVRLLLIMGMHYLQASPIENLPIVNSILNKPVSDFLYDNYQNMVTTYSEHRTVVQLSSAAVLCIGLSYYLYKKYYPVAHNCNKCSDV